MCLNLVVMMVFIMVIRVVRRTWIRARMLF